MARSIILAGAVILGILLVVDPVVRTLAGSLDNATEFVFLGIVSVGIVLLAYVYLGLGPGASACRWDADSFTLQYQGGRRREFRWSDPQLKVEISEVTYENRTEYDLTTRLPWHNNVTDELFQSILAESRQRGLDIRTRVSRSPGISVITPEIRGNAGVR